MVNVKIILAPGAGYRVKGCIPLDDNNIYVEALVSPQEIARLQKYLRSSFDNNRIVLRPRKETDDSVEVFIGEEFTGVIYRDDDEGEVSYALHISIIAEDLPEL